MSRRIALVVALLAAAACKGGGSSSASPAPGPSASSSARAEAPPASAPAPAPSASAPRGPTTKLSGQQLKDAYAAVMAEDDPFDKELGVVKGKLGEPQQTDGDTSLWWGWSPKEGAVDATCWELSMSPTEGSSIGGTDWVKCGVAE
jgi:hypothetical protein